jgi:hypothetical protein
MQLTPMTDTQARQKLVELDRRYRQVVSLTLTDLLRKKAGLEQMP